MSCPAANILFRIPLISEEIKHDVRIQINIKLRKIASLKHKYQRTCHSDITRWTLLSKSILQEMGALKELRVMDSSFSAHWNSYKIEWVSRHLDHSCLTRPENNNPSQPEVIDLSTSDNSDSEVCVLDPETQSHPAS